MHTSIATALPAGATMTLLILFGMQALIAMQPGAAVQTSARTLPPWIAAPREEELFRDDFQPEEIPDIVPTPRTHVTDEAVPNTTGLAIPPVDQRPEPDVERMSNPGFSDGPLVALVRVQPTYPANQATKGIEGFVTVMFDVLPDGSVSNVAVVESSHRGFERSAVQAASRFRFKARVADGVPLTSTGIQYRFTFEMDN